MYSVPAESTATPSGPFSHALRAAPPSPMKPRVPVPATVHMVPSGVTLRTTSFPVSAMNKLPVESTATPNGPLICALVAAPPSPVNPAVPLPATVVMVPLAAIRRTTEASRSATNRLPAASTAMPMGEFNCAATAAPLSPEFPARALPATRVSVPPASTLNTECKLLK